MGLEKFTSRSGVMLRVEDRVTGTGPYSLSPRLGDGTIFEYPWHYGTGCPCDPIQHPTWRDDHSLPRIKDLGSRWDSYLFGFDTVDQYLAWFSTPKARKALTKAGMVLALYLSPRVFISPRQALGYLPDRSCGRLKECPCTFPETHPAVEEEIRDVQYAAG